MNESNQNPPVEGANQNSPVDGLVGDNNPESKEEFVKYSTYQKILNEKRNLASKHADTVAQLAKFESERKEREESEMREQNRYQELLEAREKELADTRGQLDSTRKDIEYAQKMHAFNESLGHSKLDPAYYSLVPIDEIKFTDEGHIDQESLNAVATNFKTRHARLIDDPRNDLPSQRPGLSTGKKLTPEEWRKLSSKEMSARWQEVDFSQS